MSNSKSDDYHYVCNCLYTRTRNLNQEDILISYRWNTESRASDLIFEMRVLDREILPKSIKESRYILLPSQGLELYLLLARDETLEKISSDSSGLSLIRRLLRRVCVTETHDPSGRDTPRDLNRANIS